METTHTPGPWIVGAAVNTPDFPDSLAVWPAAAAVEHQKGHAICLLSALAKADEQDEQNAALIAAAPDMLAALKLASETIVRVAETWYDETPRFLIDVSSTIAKAVAKAEGKVA